MPSSNGGQTISVCLNFRNSAMSYLHGTTRRSTAIKTGEASWAVQEKKDQKYIDLVSKVAQDVLPVSNARIASAIVIGNTVVGLGRNSYKTHPLQAKYGKTEHTIHLHAEIDAIKNSLRRVSVDDLTKATIYISRVKKRDRKRGFVPGLSAPCSGCMGAITDFGTKRIVYSLDGEGFRVIE